MRLSEHWGVALCVVLGVFLVVLSVSVLHNTLAKANARARAELRAEAERAGAQQFWLGTPPGPNETVQHYVRTRLNDIEARLRALEGQSCR